MKPTSRFSRAHHASPSPRSSTISPFVHSSSVDVARSSSRSPVSSRSQTKQLWALGPLESRQTMFSSTCAKSSDEPIVEMISRRTPLSWMWSVAVAIREAYPGSRR
jgi:hypothetical protein